MGFCDLLCDRSYSNRTLNYPRKDSVAPLNIQHNMSLKSNAIEPYQAKIVQNYILAFHISMKFIICFKSLEVQFEAQNRDFQKTSIMNRWRHSGLLKRSIQV